MLVDEGWAGTGDDGRFTRDKVRAALEPLGGVTVEAAGGDFEVHRHAALDGAAGRDTITIACRKGDPTKAADALRAAGYRPTMSPGGRVIVLRQQHHHAVTQPHHRVPPPGFKLIPDDPRGGYSRTDGEQVTHWHPGVGLSHGSP